MARRPAHLGPGHSRGSHSTRRPIVDRTSLPNVERSQHVCADQACSAQFQVNGTPAWVKPALTSSILSKISAMAFPRDS